MKKVVKAFIYASGFTILGLCLYPFVHEIISPSLVGAPPMDYFVIYGLAGFLVMFFYFARVFRD